MITFNRIMTTAITIITMALMIVSPAHANTKTTAHNDATVEIQAHYVDGTEKCFGDIVDNEWVIADIDCVLSGSIPVKKNTDSTVTTIKTNDNNRPYAFGSSTLEETTISMSTSSANFDYIDIAITPKDSHTQEYTALDVQFNDDEEIALIKIESTKE